MRDIDISVVIVRNISMMGSKVSGGDANDSDTACYAIKSGRLEEDEVSYSRS